MCEERTAAKTKIDRLIDSMDRLSTALWWQRADPCQLNIPQLNATSLPSAIECGLEQQCARGGPAEAVVGL